MRILIIAAALNLLFFARLPNARGEDYSECRQQCDADYSDCINEPPAPDPEVREAERSSCDRTLASCRAQCENLKPVETPPPFENTPNIIVK